MKNRATAMIYFVIATAILGLVAIAIFFSLNSAGGSGTRERGKRSSRGVTRSELKLEEEVVGKPDSAKEENHSKLTEEETFN